MKSRDRFWTDAAVAELLALAAEGKSASQIAMALGAPTRNVVIGKANRHGIKLMGKRSGGRTGGRPRAAKAPAPAPAPAAVPLAVMVPEVVVEIVRATPPPEPPEVAPPPCAPSPAPPPVPAGARCAVARQPTAAEPAPVAAKSAPAPPRPAPIAVAPAPVKPTPEAATSGPCTIMELSDYRCRFIPGAVKGADTIYCGVAKLADAGPYCKIHTELATGKPHSNALASQSSTRRA